ncbi:unnamed protein product [Amoebophrya sp. A120]|nr:unnamed protein product [Amoebophrya sp. A120]|eukprot:GSA120T00023202001.1
MMPGRNHKQMFLSRLTSLAGIAVWCAAFFTIRLQHVVEELLGAVEERLGDTTPPGGPRGVPRPSFGASRTSSHTLLFAEAKRRSFLRSASGGGAAGGRGPRNNSRGNKTDAPSGQSVFSREKSRQLSAFLTCVVDLQNSAGEVEGESHGSSSSSSWSSTKSTGSTSSSSAGRGTRPGHAASNQRTGPNYYAATSAPEGVSCPICLEPVCVREHQDPAGQTSSRISFGLWPCGHFIHGKCYSQMRRARTYQGRCPVCRTETEEILALNPVEMMMPSTSCTTSRRGRVTARSNKNSSVDQQANHLLAQFLTLVDRVVDGGEQPPSWVRTTPSRAPGVVVPQCLRWAGATCGRALAKLFRVERLRRFAREISSSGTSSAGPPRGPGADETAEMNSSRAAHVQHRLGECTRHIGRISASCLRAARWAAQLVVLANAIGFLHDTTYSGLRGNEKGVSDDDLARLGLALALLRNLALAFVTEDALKSLCGRKNKYGQLLAWTLRVFAVQCLRVRPVRAPHVRPSATFLEPLQQLQMARDTLADFIRSGPCAGAAAMTGASAFSAAAAAVIEGGTTGGSSGTINAGTSASSTFLSRSLQGGINILEAAAQQPAGPAGASPLQFLSTTACASVTHAGLLAVQAVQEMLVRLALGEPLFGSCAPRETGLYFLAQGTALANLAKMVLWDGGGSLCRLAGELAALVADVCTDAVGRPVVNFAVSEAEEESIAALRFDVLTELVGAAVLHSYSSGLPPPYVPVKVVPEPLAPLDHCAAAYTADPFAKAEIRTLLRLLRTGLQSARICRVPPPAGASRGSRQQPELQHGRPAGDPAVRRKLLSRGSRHHSWASSTGSGTPRTRGSTLFDSDSDLEDEDINTTG